MTLSSRLHRVFYEWLRTLYKSCGHDIFGPNGFEISALTLIVYAVFVIFTTCLFYTVFVYDWFDRFNVVAFMGIDCQLLMKMCSVQHGPLIKHMLDQLVDIVKANEKHPSNKRMKNIQRFVAFSENVLKFGIVLYASAVCSFCLNPLIVYLFEKKIVTMLPYYLPYVNETTIIGYIGLSIFQLIAMGLGTFGTASADFTFVLILINMPMIAYLFCETFNELNVEVKAVKSNLVTVKAQLRNILLQHRQIVEFTSDLDTIFFRITFVQNHGVTATLMAILVLCIKYAYIPAFVLGLAALFQLVCWCALGTIVEISNDMMYDGIIGFDWYLLRPKQQLSFGNLMNYAQNAQTLTIGGLVPLNMDTCVRIRKSMYSFTMALLTFMT